MDKPIYLNWRIHLLFLLGIITVLLVLSDCDDWLGLIVSKAIGFTLGYTTYRLAKYWNKKEQLNNLSDLVDEE